MKAKVKSSCPKGTVNHSTDRPNKSQIGFHSGVQKGEGLAVLLRLMDDRLNLNAYLDLG